MITAETQRSQRTEESDVTCSLRSLRLRGDFDMMNSDWS